MSSHATVVTDMGYSEALNRHSSDPRRIRFQRSLRSSWWRMDMACLCAAMLWMVLGHPIDTHPSTIASVLALRVSLVNFLLAVACVFLWRFCMFATRLHPGSSPVSLFLLTFQIVLRVTACTGAAGLILIIRHPGRPTSSDLAMFWAVSFLMFSIERAGALALAVYIAPSFRHERKIIIVGTGGRAQRFSERIKSHPKWRYQILGFVDDEPQFQSQGLLGGTEDLESILMGQVVDEVVVALPVKSKYDEIQKAIAVCERMGIQSGYSMDLFSTEITKRRSVEEHDPSSVVLHMIHDDDRRHLKRAFDVAAAGIGLVLLSPLLLVVAIAVKCTSRGPIIFRQQRFGLNKRMFYIYKFRSMVVDAEFRQKHLEHLNEAEGSVFKIREDPRVTAVGRLIRKTSIDELPQLFNVLRGDMSLVGPRPLPIRDVSRFSDAWLMRRFSVRPGLTCIWQISGRSNTSFDKWMQQDLDYIDRWSLGLDLTILVRTVPAVLRGSGAA
jgi:exopolysaccharide biosynthesis polyprenyl glycosylphosphotransferase